jgi:PAS domain S-box-containing protein
MTSVAGYAGSLNRQRASQIAAFVATAIAAAAFIGWWAELPLLSSWGSGLAPMKPPTALCLAALGLALMHPGHYARLAFVAGLAVAAVAMLDSGLLLFGVDLGMGRLQKSTNAGVASFAAALGLVLVGTALALSGFQRFRLAATVLCSLTGAIAVFVLLGYLSGIDTLYGSTSVRSPPLPTAVGLLCTACGIVLRTGVIPALTPRPLRHLLIMLGGAIIAPLVLFGAYAGVRMADAQLEQVREELMSDARILSSDVDREIVGEIETLLGLAASPSLRQGDFAEFQRQAEAALALRRSGNIALLDRDMQQLVNTAVTFGTSLPKVAVPESVEKALATGKPQVTGLFADPVTKQPLYGIIVPIQIDGEYRYALVRSPSQQALARVIAANELPPGRQGMVSDAAHRIVARSDQHDAMIGKELPSAQWHRAGPDGVFEFIDSEGRPSLGAYTWSELTGWETVVWAPKALLGAPLWALWRTLGWMALLALMLVVALALWLGRIIARSVGHAARTAIAWGEGGPLSVNGTPVTELNTLMAELRKAAARRETAEGMVRDSEQRLRFALNAAQLGWWQYDPLHRMVSGDTRFKEIFDVADHEAAIDEIVKRVHPDDAGRVRVAFERALDPADPRPLAIGYRVDREDGKIRWLEAHGLAYFEGAGPGRRVARVVGTIADITERKEHEERANLLTREINHRAKNMLSVVDAIAHQIAAGNPEDFAPRFSERIQALAANQDLLIRNEWKGVELEDLVRAQLAHFADLIGSRITMQGPKLRLKGASAQAIGLALHELATNAGKYGALSTDAGRVDIRWGRDGDTLTMGWIERDGPPVSPPKQRGFGTIVMEAMAARSVDGAVQLDYPPSGVTWRLTCPAANALEAGWGMAGNFYPDSELFTFQLEHGNENQWPASNIR